MNPRLISLSVSAVSAVILFGAIAFVFTLVVLSLVNGGLEFGGEPEIADADTGSAALAAFMGLAA